MVSIHFLSAFGLSNGFEWRIIWIFMRLEECRGLDVTRWKRKLMKLFLMCGVPSPDPSHVNECHFDFVSLSSFYRSEFLLRWQRKKKWYSSHKRTGIKCEEHWKHFSHFSFLFCKIKFYGKSYFVAVLNLNFLCLQIFHF